MRVYGVNGVLLQPCVVRVDLRQDGQLIRRRGRTLPPGRVAPVAAGGQGQLEALLQGGPRQTEVCTVWGGNL